METTALLEIIETVLEDKKAQKIMVIDVQGRTSVTDYMVVATGTSNRHIASMGHYVAESVKEKGFKPLGIEGDQGSDWVLVDLGDVILHLMTEQARDYYQLEKLWAVPAAAKEQQIA
ncbi:MAG: ribosome silencing factor [Methylococcaceae bacterium]|nr:ribosome silencing factor [Methylococcaceae bacterium]